MLDHVLIGSTLIMEDYQLYKDKAIMNNMNLVGF